MPKFYEDPIYIEMCRAAEEIQSSWNPGKGDWFKRGGWTHCLGRGLIEYDYDMEQTIAPEITPDHENEDGYYVDGAAMKFANGYDGHDWVVLSECTWLPRLDQLIEMIGRPVVELLVEIYRWDCGHQGAGESRGYDRSWEIMFLGYLMEIKYGKCWNGDEWVAGDNL